MNQIVSHSTEIVVRSAAKVNLTLDVLGVRDDGYHELRSVVHTLGIWDTISFRFSASNGLTFRCDNTELETDDNLCLKAARLWAQTANQVLDVEIFLQKTIPTGAGLGGGSGNAAAVLRTMNRHFNDALSEAKLHELATQLGADVPLFLRGGGVLIEGIGEKMTPLKTLPGWLVVLQSSQKLATPQVFRVWDELQIPTKNASANFLQLMGRNADWTQLANALQNDLTLAAAKCGVDVEDVVARLRKSGALGAAMSGSGSACFGVFAEETAARNALKNLRDSGCNFVAVAPLCDCGIEWVSASD